MEKENKKGKIIVSKNGPYLVSGKLHLEKETIITDGDDFPCKWEKGQKYPEKEAYSLCRCGKSENKPFCDGTHIDVGFRDREKSSEE